MVTSKFETVKLIRSFSGLNLADAVEIAETWEKAFSNSFICNDLSQILALGIMCKKIRDGEWKFNDRREILITKIVSLEDIRNLVP